MTDAVDMRLFQELARRPVEDVIHPPFCHYDMEEECYRVKAWHRDYRIYPRTSRIEFSGDAVEQHDYFYVFLINYLLSEKSEKSTGDWISEKDLTGGVTFFRGPHQIPTHLITRQFGNDIELVKEKCESLAGTPLAMADCSYSFDVVGSVKVALLYWQGDEDFPPEAKLLIDRSVADTLQLDVFYALLCDACVRIAK